MNSAYKQQALSNVFIASSNNHKDFIASSCGVKGLSGRCAMLRRSAAVNATYVYQLKKVIPFEWEGWGRGGGSFHLLSFSVESRDKPTKKRAEVSFACYHKAILLSSVKHESFHVMKFCALWQLEKIIVGHVN